MTIDFEADAGSANEADDKGEGKLGQVSVMAQRINKLNAEMDALSAQVAEKKSELDRLESADLPDLMESLQLKEFTTHEGDKVQVKPIVRASLPTQTSINKARHNERAVLEARLEAGLKYLRENGAEAMIKNELSVDLGKDNDALANKVEEALTGFGLHPQRAVTVNTNTLTAYVREKIEAGDKTLSLETFKVFTGRKATVTKRR